MNIFALELSRLPISSLEILLRLAKTLVRDEPKHDSSAITQTKKDLLVEILRSNKGLTTRLIAQNPELMTSRVAFDRAVDGLWIMLRRTLEFHQAYAHEGLDALPDELAAEAELDELRAEAAMAQRVWARLFGAKGTKFTRYKFISQAESMAAILRLLDEDDLRADLESVVGKALPRLLEACQKHYEMLASAQLSSDSADANLSELLTDLRWAIVAYVNAVQTLYRRQQPETGEVVYQALRSIVSLRELLARPNGAESIGEGDEAFDLDEIDGLLEQGEDQDDETTLEAEV